MMSSPRVVRGLLVLGAVCFLESSPSEAQASLIHEYRLDNSYADSLGGPSLVPQGGTLGPTAYSFGPNQGLVLSNALPNAGNYSIEIIFNFSTLTGFRRILDFADRTSDDGLYTSDTALRFYPVASGPSGAFSASQDVRLVVTRDDGTDEYVGYINGVQQFSFIDNLNLAVFSQPSNVMRFFQDDLVFQNEASAGVVDLIRIYDTPLSASEVAALEGLLPVPEPGTALTGIAMLLFGGGVWLRRRRTA